MDILLIILFVILILLVLFMLLADADLTLLFHHVFSSKIDYRGKVIWITGASSGIGEYLAFGLIKRNAKLALSGVNTDRLENVKRHCIEYSKCKEEDILLVPFKIQNFKEHEDCMKKVIDHFGHIDVLINNAGLSQRADFQEIDIDVDQYLFNVNVFGAVNLSRKVLRHFLERKSGQFVVSSSVAGKLGAPFSSTYTGSKHALHGYFESLRSELIGKNIDITIACPGPVFSLLTDRCLTGKTGEVFDHKQQPTDNKMKTERCSELMITAMSHKLPECWISIQPILFVMYFAQYTPAIFKSILLKLFFNKKVVMKLRQGR